MLQSALLMLLILSYVNAPSQTIPLRELTTLPAPLAETSGVTASHANLIWSHNDSGGEPVLYGFDTLGVLVRTITVTNAVNTDWEDVTQDAQGNLYVGDIGNNANTRKDLRIYKIPSPDSFTENRVAAQTISFSYGDQTGFPPANNGKNFDAEAIIAFRDSLFVFSKNQTNPFIGYTKLYKMPGKPGTYTLAPVDSFLVDPEPVKGQITSAAISPDGKTLALLTYGQLLVFRDFTGSQFFRGNVTRLAFASITQKEAVCFVSDCQLYLTDEALMGTGQKLYSATICQITGLQQSPANSDIRLEMPVPNPSQDYFTCGYSLPVSVPEGEMVLTNTNGRLVCRVAVRSKAKSVQISTAEMPSGTYFCTLQTTQGKSITRKVVIAK